MTTSRSLLVDDGVSAGVVTDGLLYYTRCPVPTATGLAVGLGLLAPALGERHQVQLRALQDASEARLRRHHFDHGLANLIREGGNIPALWAYSKGVPTRLLGITWLDEYQAIVTTSSSSIETVADLAGRRVAVPSSPDSIIDVARASALRGFERALSTAGLGLDAVEILDTPTEPFSGPSSDGRGEHFDVELDALDSGEVDAVWLKGAGGLAGARARGLSEVFRIDLDPDPLVRVNNGTPRTITVRQELIDERPDVVRTYLETLSEGPQAIGSDHRRLWEVLSSETHQSAENAELAYTQVKPDSLLASLEAPRLQGLQHQADFLFAQGFIPKRIDIDAWALDGFLTQAGEA